MRKKITEFRPYRFPAGSNGNSVGQITVKDRETIYRRFALDRNQGSETYGWYVGDFVHTNLPFTGDNGFPKALALLTKANAELTQRGEPALNVQIKENLRESYIDGTLPSFIAMDVNSYEKFQEWINAQQPSIPASSPRL